MTAEPLWRDTPIRVHPSDATSLWVYDALGGQSHLLQFQRLTPMMWIERFLSTRKGAFSSPSASGDISPSRDLLSHSKKADRASRIQLGGLG